MRGPICLSLFVSIVLHLGITLCIYYPEILLLFPFIFTILLDRDANLRSGHAISEYYYGDFDYWYNISNDRGVVDGAKLAYILLISMLVFWLVLYMMMPTEEEKSTNINNGAESKIVLKCASAVRISSRESSTVFPIKNLKCVAAAVAIIFGKYIPFM
jgi:hypothetical protein